MHCGAKQGKNGVGKVLLHLNNVFVSTEEVTEPQLPGPLPLQTLFVSRLAFVSGEVEDGGLSPTLWYSTPLSDDIDPEVDLVSFYSILAVT